jgi:hypothetical protein
MAGHNRVNIMLRRKPVGWRSLALCRSAGRQDGADAPNHAGASRHRLLGANQGTPSGFVVDLEAKFLCILTF